MESNPKKDVRVSQRSTKGAAPERYGYPRRQELTLGGRVRGGDGPSSSQRMSEPSLMVSIKEAGAVNESSSQVLMGGSQAGGSQNTVSVSSFTASTIKKQEIELKLKEDMIYLTNKEEELKVQQQKVQVDRMRKDLDRLHAELKSFGEQGDDNKVQVTKLKIEESQSKIKETLESLEDREFEVEMKALERAKEVVQLRTAVETNKIDLEIREEQYLGSDEDEEGDLVPEWLDVSLPDEEKDLKRRLDALKNVQRPPSPPKKRYKPNPPPRKDKMDLFLSRQTINQNLPVFDGKLDEWPIFISQYKMTTEACGLSDIENIQRLQKSLKGAARMTVQSMLVSANNVPKIITVLEARYGKPKAILESIMNQVRKVPTVKGGDDGSLLQLVDGVRNLTATALAFKCQPYLSNPQLVDELVMKLPDFRRDSWCRRVRELNTEFPSLLQLSEWLEEEGAKVSLLFNPSSHQEAKSEKKSEKGARHNEKVYVTSTKEEDNSTKEKKCFLCQGPSHDPEDCQKFKDETVDSRYKWIQKNRRCFCCLKFGHPVKGCKSKKKCGKDGCEKIHHELLHLSQEVVAEAEVVTLAKHSQEKKGNSVNLLILPVKLKGPNGTIDTFAMLDSGSTATLISEGMAQEL